MVRGRAIGRVGGTLVLSNCALWREPEATVAKGLRSVFVLVETFARESHWWRYLLRCRECGQLYVFEFYEEVDWEGGQDPQYSTWVPISSEAEIADILQAPRGELATFVPRLCKDWPKGQSKAVLHWIVAADRYQ